MEPNFTQEDLKEFAMDTPIILAYRKAYIVRYDQGGERWELKLLLEWHGDCPLTDKGHFAPVTARCFKERYLYI